MHYPPIQIVDENDLPAGKASMAEAEEKGLIRRIVRLMLENQKGQVLLQKRSRKVKAYPGRWDNSVAGHVDFGETNEEALLRETSEELGIEGISFRKIGSYYNEVSRDSSKLKKFNHVYKAVYEDTPQNLDESEVSGVEWFDVGKLKQAMREDPDQFTDGILEVITRYY